MPEPVLHPAPVSTKRRGCRAMKSASCAASANDEPSRVVVSGFVLYRCALTAGDPMAKLYFYYSAMNAGKTTTLLQSAYNYHERGMRTLILTPALDHRGGEVMVASRIGLKAPGRRFDRDDDLLAVVRDDVAARGKLGCVLVDEAHFLTRAQAWQLTDVVDVLGIPVLAYGLRTDFRGELFEGS